MTKGERLRAVRKNLGLTLKDFGAALGVRGTAISNIELGDSNLTEQMTKAICREFNVNYDYLVYGDGEMFDNLPETLIDELTIEYDLTPPEATVIREYLKLPADQREVIMGFLQTIAANMPKKDDKNSEDE